MDLLYVFFSDGVRGFRGCYRNILFTLICAIEQEEEPPSCCLRCREPCHCREGAWRWPSPGVRWSPGHCGQLLSLTDAHVSVSAPMLGHTKPLCSCPWCYGTVCLERLSGQGQAVGVSGRCGGAPTLQEGEIVTSLLLLKTRQ